MARGENYEKFLNKRSKLDDEFAERISIQISRISSKLIAIQSKSHESYSDISQHYPSFEEVAYRDYRQLELNFFDLVYGRSDDRIFSNDPNWDRFVRKEAKKSDDYRLLELHTFIQANRADAANQYWEDFVSTDSNDALIAYLEAGGEINQNVRCAIIDAIPNKTNKALLDRYETVLRVTQIIAESEQDISISAACDQLAKIECPPNHEQDVEDEKEGKSRNYRRHIEKFEKHTGLKLPRK